jgi:ribose 5-phosphate isomerase B
MTKYSAPAMRGCIYNVAPLGLVNCMPKTPTKKPEKPSKTDADGKKKAAHSIAGIIRKGLLAGKSATDIVKNVKKAFPDAKTTTATVHNYRSALRKEGIEVETVRKKRKIKPKNTSSTTQRKQAKAKAKTTGVADVIRSGLLIGKTADDIAKDVKKAFPDAKTTAATVHNYRSAMRKEGIEVETVRKKRRTKTKASAKKRTSRKRKIQDVVREALLAGKTNDAVVSVVKQEFPQAKTSRNSVAIYRSKLRSENNAIPTNEDAKKQSAQIPYSSPAVIKAPPPASKVTKPIARKKPEIGTKTAGLTIALASDHAGFALKATLRKALEAQGMNVLDLGTNTQDSVDYSDYATAVAQAMAWGQASRGVVICGSGIGISIAINRYRHVRAALCTSGLMARLARLHNDANVLALGARLVGEDVALECLQEFLNTQFEGGRHSRRVEKMS